MIDRIFPTSYGNIFIQILGKPAADIEESNGFWNFQDVKYRISKKVHFSEENIFSVRQVHGDLVHSIRDLDHRFKKEGDGLYSEMGNQLLYVKTADCLPLFFWSEKYLFYGVIHVGWRGLRSRIAEKFFLKILEENPEIYDLNIFFGPSICQKNYTIQKDVAIYFQDHPLSLFEFEGGYKFALKETQKENLRKLPLNFHFYDSEICTFESQEFFSHRRNDPGRNLNLIWSLNQ